jgi:hypothetical protein
VVRGVDPQLLLEDAKARIARDVKGEQARRADLPSTAEPDKRARERKVEDQLVEERRVERCVPLVAVGPVGRIDPQGPRQGRRAAEELLIEVVADPPDRLGDEGAGSGGTHERAERDAAPAQNPKAGERAAGDAAPDPEAALPDGKPSPPRSGTSLEVVTSKYRRPPRMPAGTAMNATSATRLGSPPCARQRRRAITIADRIPTTQARP